MFVGRLIATVAVAAIVSASGACSASPPDPGELAPAQAVAAPPASPLAKEPRRFALRVLATYPHDPTAYTQGLVWHAGALYESTGQYGSSTLRRVRLADGAIERSLSVPSDRFAEGLALVGDELIQLSWKEGIASRHAVLDLAPRGELRYVGEGWGLCFDGTRLVMSDGSDRLQFRDPKTFAPFGEISVVRAGRPVFHLNELECVEGEVWANVWQSEEIVAIDPETGEVTAVVDASGLLSGADAAHAEVLNGLAWNPDLKRFYITGKYWPKLFEVELVPVP